MNNFTTRRNILIPDAERQRVRVQGHYGYGTTISRTWCGDFLVSITVAMDNGQDVVVGPACVTVDDGVRVMAENVVPFVQRARPGIKRENTDA